MGEAQRGPANRVVVFDTETTGLDPADGHRVVEVACVELVNLVPTGRELHFHCNPDRDMPVEAFAIHGLTAEFLADHPRFEEQLPRFLEFVADAEALVAHNADFDMKFLAAEFRRCGTPPLTHVVVDTLALARRKFPGSPASLDALCRRFDIDLSERTKHGAMIDTQLLARVYLELMGGHQPGLDLAANAAVEAAAFAARRIARPARPHQASPGELALHQAMVETLTDPLWQA